MYFPIYSTENHRFSHLIWFLQPSPVSPGSPGRLFQGLQRVVPAGLTNQQGGLKGKFIETYHIKWENLWFPVGFPFNQSIATDQQV